MEYEPYTGAHVVTQLQLLLFSGLAFFVMLPYLKRTLTITLDTDWVWRRLLPALLAPLARLTRAAQTALRHSAQQGGANLLSLVHRHHGPRGRIAGTWPTGSMALWVLVLLLGYLLLYYL